MWTIPLTKPTQVAVSQYGLAVATPSPACAIAVRCSRVWCRLRQAVRSKPSEAQEALQARLGAGLTSRQRASADGTGRKRCREPKSKLLVEDCGDDARGDRGGGGGAGVFWWGTPAAGFLTRGCCRGGRSGAFSRASAAGFRTRSDR
eukprot:125310-Chlamydomonas_euryale.AAC.5